MNFGLGLVLSFTDNASAGINRAVSSLTQLTGEAEKASGSLESLALNAFSNITGQLGSSLSNSGKRIIGTYANIINKVNNVGQTLMYANQQLATLYGSEEKGAEIMEQIAEYAKTSIFEYEDLIGIVTMLKATGIEAFNEISNSAGTVSQTLMDYASDLAAFNPSMHNMYGTGISAAMGALKEYIAEGNKRSLLSGAGLDITAILGEDKGKTIEERSRQVADLLDQIGMIGMTASMANSPMTKLSNIQDTLFQLMGKIADSGVYDAYTRIISVFADFINSIPEEKLDALAQVVGSALSDLMKPIEFITTKLVDFLKVFTDLLLENPAIGKFIVKITALGGAFLFVGGTLLTILSVLGRVANGLMLFKTFFATIPGIVAGGASAIVTALAPIALTIGTILFIWKTDLLAIRTVVTEFVNNVVNSFRTARNMIKGDLGSLQTALEEYKTRDDFFSGLTLAIAKVGLAFSALKEAWDDNTLSEDTYLKAKELGILPLIEAILDLKWRFSFLVGGLKRGFDDIATKAEEVWGKLEDLVRGTIFEDLIDKVTEFFQLLASGDPDTWYAYGRALAYVTAAVVALVVAIKVFNIVTGIAAGLIGLLTSPITLVIAAIVLCIVIWKKFGDNIMSILRKVGNFFSAVGKGIVKTFTDIWTVIKTFVNFVIDIVKTIVDIGAGVVNFFTDTLPNKISDGISAIRGFFTDIGDFARNAWEDIKSVFSGFADFFGGIISGAWETIKAAFTFGGEIFEGIAGGITEVFTAVINKLIDGINTVVSLPFEGINAVLGRIHDIKIVGRKPFSFIDEIEIPEIPHLELATGGVVSSATPAIIGEDGAEAVIPLEKNTGWLNRMSDMIVRGIASNNTPVGNVDNSVVFNSGAITIVANNASEAEAERLANRIIAIIKRKTEINNMLSYN